MTATAVKLTDLIARNRGPHRAPLSVETGAADADCEAAQTKADDCTSHLASPAARPIVQDIESLALKLYSISRQNSADPAVVMREALRSIEACLVAIKKHH